MKNKKLLAYIFTFVLAFGTMAVSIATGQNSNFIRNEAYETPMRIDLSYENKQLTNDAHSTGTYYYVDVKTYRNNTVRLLQDGVSYLDDVKKVRLGLDGWFGNLMESSGVERDPINGLTKIHFENGNNLKVKYGWSATVQSPREEIPDAHGDVYFDGLKPSYFRVTIDNYEQATFSSCEIYYDCVAADAPGSNPSASNIVVNQSFYGEEPCDLYIVDNPDASLAAHLSTGNYIYAERDKPLNEALDLHNMVMSFDLDKKVAGQKHFDDVRLDDRFVTNLSIEFVDNNQSKTKEYEQSMRLSFTYKNTVTISNQFTLFGYYRLDTHHNVVSVDNVRQQSDNTLPKDNKVLIWSFVEIISFGTIDQFSLSHPQRQFGRASFYRTMTFEELQSCDLQLDSNPFTAVGKHELSFKLDSRYRLFGTYLVFNESNYIKSVEYKGFKEEIEPGFDLVSYFDSGNAYVTFKYQDGTSKDVSITASDVDLSYVDTKIEGTYPYYVNIEVYGKIKQFVSVVLTDIGDETDATIYSVPEENKEDVTVCGFDKFGAINTFYVKSIATKDNKYHATCYLELEHPENTFNCFGTYKFDENNDHEIILFGQLWCSRLLFENGSDSKHFNLVSHSEIETDHSYTYTIFVPDENSFLYTKDNPIHFYSSENNEMKIIYNELTFRTTCVYLNEEKTRISFNVPYIIMFVTTLNLRLEATLDNQSHTIHIEKPAGVE